MTHPLLARMLSAFLTLSVLLIALAGCHSQEPAARDVQPPHTEIPAAPSQHDGERNYSYSPFVVEVSDMSHPFHQVSFKDVGMSLHPEERSFVYETLAESVRQSLENQGVPATVAYDTQWSDPQHHLSCEGQHIYVDVWHPADTKDWGYSLWSGCGEDSEFGRGTVNSSSDPVDAAQPVADDIALQLRAAVEKRCFRREC